MGNEVYRVEIYGGSTHGWSDVGYSRGVALDLLQARYPGNLGYRVTLYVGAVDPQCRRITE